MRKQYHYYRRCRVVQEVRQNCEYREDGERVQWGRPCRRLAHLNVWGELEQTHAFQKSWKKKRKTHQWHDQRLSRWETTVGTWKEVLILERYLQKHNICYHTIAEKTTYLIYYHPEYGRWGQFKFDGNEWVLDHWLEYEALWNRYTSSINYYSIIWWHDKDICPDMII